MKFLEVKTKEIEHNLIELRKYLEQKSKEDKVKKPDIIAVVKANMYGFGMEKFAKILNENGVTNFAVADPKEALDLRNSGIKDNIFLLTPTLEVSEIEQLILNDVILTVSSMEDLKVLDRVCRDIKKSANISIKIDTGFSRYGVVYSDEMEILNIYKEANRLKNINIISTFSHFSEAFSKNSKFTKLQYDRFIGVLKLLKDNDLQYGFAHIANSNAILQSSKYFLDAIRPGSLFLGRVLLKNTKINLKKIGLLKVKVDEIKVIPKDTYIGYSRTYKTKKDTKIAILPIGHIDGIFIEPSNDAFRLTDKLSKLKRTVINLFSKKRLKVSIRGKQYDIIGKVGTKFIIVDITDSKVKKGDYAIINCSYNYLNKDLKRLYV